MGIFSCDDRWMLPLYSLQRKLEERPRNLLVYRHSPDDHTKSKMQDELFQKKPNQSTMTSITTLKDWLLGSAPPAVLIMDGGVSTHLEQLVGGTKPFSHRSLWSSSLLLTPEGRSTIQQGHENWLQAGSDILTTVTYQCHYGALDRDPVLEESQMTELFQEGVRLAKAAVEARNNKSDNYSRRKYVVASSGCYGAALADGAEYTGKYPGMTHERLVEFHQCKSHALLEQRPDGLAIETIPSHAEVRAVCQVLKDLSSASIKKATTPACWISLACRNSSELNEEPLFKIPCKPFEN